MFWELEALGIKENEISIRLVHREHRTARWQILCQTTQEGHSTTQLRPLPQAAVWAAEETQAGNLPTEGI